MRFRVAVIGFIRRAVRAHNTQTIIQFKPFPWFHHSYPCEYLPPPPLPASHCNPQSAILQPPCSPRVCYNASRAAPLVHTRFHAVASAHPEPHHPRGLRHVPPNHALVATCSPAPQDPARAMMPLCLRPTPVRGYQDTSHGGGTCRTETESTDAAIHLGLFSWDTEG